MHSSGSMTRMRSASWMQSTGQTSTHERSLMSMHGSAMMYVTAGLLYRGAQLSDELSRPLLERRLHHDVIEAGLVRAAQSGSVGVVREAEERAVRVRLCDVGRIDARDVRDHEVGRDDRVRGHEGLPGERGLQLAPEEEIDPSQQDRRHATRVDRCAASVESNVRSGREGRRDRAGDGQARRSEEHTSELQSQSNLVCRLLLEKKKKVNIISILRVTLTAPAGCLYHRSPSLSRTLRRNSTGRRCTPRTCGAERRLGRLS